MPNKCEDCECMCYSPQYKECSFPERVIIYKTIYYNFLKKREPLRVIKIDDIVLEFFEINDNEKTQIKSLFSSIKTVKNAYFYNCVIETRNYIRINNTILLLVSKLEMCLRDIERNMKCVIETTDNNTLFLVRGYKKL